MAPTNPRYRARSSWRRGNTIVLVVGVLALLAIIATSFVTRTHAGRLTSTGMQRSRVRQDLARDVAEQIAQEIALGLFVHPVDEFNDPCADPASAGVGDCTGTASPNVPRLAPHGPRYAVDARDFNDDGVRDFMFGYNFAPYEVVPYTNWPDAQGFIQVMNWPKGPGNPNGNTQGAYQFETNAQGHPGFGDTRWLRDLEPMPWSADGDPQQLPDANMMYRHMTNIARPNNGWRVCKDIADLTNADLSNNTYGGVVSDLTLPIEQWMLVQPSQETGGLSLFTQTGDTSFDFGAADPMFNFIDRWQRRFNPGLPPYSADGQAIQKAWADARYIAPNYYRLADLDGDGARHEIGERPADEFIRGRARWMVNRVLADADGDGFTDSFWFLVPGAVDRGVRQIAAVSIVDNSAMVNINVGSQLMTDDPLNVEATTIGATPADLVLVAGNQSDNVTFVQPDPTWNIGFLDNWFANEDMAAGIELYDEDTVQGWAPLKWCDFLAARNIDLTGSNSPTCLDSFNTRAQRLDWWQWAGRRPLNALGGFNSIGAYTPFGLSDELELRMFHGSNHPWHLVRLETSTDWEANGSDDLNRYFLRSRSSAEESGHYLNSLNNRELFFDNRHLVTTYSGARNDQMPPYMWWENRYYVPTGGPNDDVIRRNMLQARTKVDLRREVPVGVPTPGVLSLSERLSRSLMLALSDGDSVEGNSYFGSYNAGSPANLDKTRRLASAFAANILEYRDENPTGAHHAFLEDTQIKVGVQPSPENFASGQAIAPETDVRYLGMEPQPFLVEVLIGHVYEASLTVFPGYTNSGNNVVCGDPLGGGGGGDSSKPLVVVQIANPYDFDMLPADLARFRLRVFGDEASGREIDLGAYGILPARSAKTFYAFESLGNLSASEWEQALGLDGNNGEIVIGDDVTGDGWETTSRSEYNSGANGDHAVEIVRLVPQSVTNQATLHHVVVDRIDIKPDNDDEYGDTISTLTFPDACDAPPPPFADPLATFPGTDIGQNTHWMVWGHATRAWATSPGPTGQLTPDQINPRYVFAERAVENGESPFLLSGGNITGLVGIPSNFSDPDKDCPTSDCPGREYSMQMLNKNEPFDQVGELLNVWLFGHELEMSDPFGIVYGDTRTTFSEFMADDELSGDDEYVNRLRIVPEPVTGSPDELSSIVGTELVAGSPRAIDPWVPDVPAGARVLDAFVCDGKDYYLAQGYSGEATQGLININTAPIRSLRALPHVQKIVHRDPGTVQPPYDRNGVAEAIVQYRERYDDGMAGFITGTFNGPDYGDRDAIIDDLRGERGFSSIGELLTLREEPTQPAYDFGPNFTAFRIQPPAFRIDYAGLRPFEFANTPAPPFASHISTDVVNGPQVTLDPLEGDGVAGDAEERNLLFAGMSNLVTTRSDVFTVYMKIRSVRQNPISGVWDATDPDYILDDSRYVMLVDRSNVETPTDRPKILYFEKLPR